MTDVKLWKAGKISIPGNIQELKTDVPSAKKKF